MLELVLSELSSSASSSGVFRFHFHAHRTGTGPVRQGSTETKIYLPRPRLLLYRDRDRDHKRPSQPTEGPRPRLLQKVQLFCHFWPNFSKTVYNKSEKFALVFEFWRDCAKILEFDRFTMKFCNQNFFEICKAIFRKKFCLVSVSVTVEIFPKYRDRRPNRD